MKISLTYDDVQLIPSFSKIDHRADIKLHTLISRRYGLLNPFVASPMETVCEEDMAFTMFLMGGVGCIHRFMSIEEQVKQVRMLEYKIYGEGFGGPYENWNILDSNWHSEIQRIPIMAAIGVQEEDKERAKLLTNNGATILLIDVAHGHHQKVIDMIKWCKDHLNTNTDIIAGNIVTREAANDLENAGADGLRVGIGGGCFTPNMKVKTDNGYKQIIDINIGDNVYSHDGTINKVIDKLEFDRNEEILIINDIECTKNHEFYVVNIKYKDIVNDNNIHNYAEWIPANLLTNDYLLIETNMKLIEIKNIEKKYYTGRVYDLTVDKTHSYNINGIAVHNSLCTTRLKTGFGIPNVSALEDVILVAKTPVIADGGIRNSGDIAKALSLGASSVMLGSLLAGTKEAPGRIIEGERGALYKRYSGSASLETKLSHNKEARNIEGESEIIPFKGGTEFVLTGLIDGIKSALSYAGASNLNEFNPKYVIVTNSGLQESKPHLKMK